ncbi:MAG TPA: hypothetical protein ENK82_09480 [Campylobacterales bacterium]|nr:hypothetical protein [Campylobacterales bacterium]
MIKNILLFASTLLIFGCSTKTNQCDEEKTTDFGQLFSKDEIYHTSLVNTQKAQLIASFETKALLTATYLNPVFSTRACKKDFVEPMDDGEYFFVGVYITDSKSNEFNTKGYSLTINGLKPIQITKLDKDDPLRYEMPMVDNWSTYYKVKFKKSPKNNFSLIFENDRFGKDILNYSKEERALFESLISLNK